MKTITNYVYIILSILWLIGENGLSLMRHIYKRFFSKIEELRNYVKKKEQCHEFVKKIKVGLYYVAKLF
jgi:hemoglobin-like flavoprotein